MTEKAERDRSTDNVDERQILIFKALPDFYHLFTETLKAESPSSHNLQRLMDLESVSTTTGCVEL